jgi:hypothetical protein
MKKPKSQYTQDQLINLLSFWEVQKAKGNKEADAKIEMINQEFAKLKM